MTKPLLWFSYKTKKIYNSACYSYYNINKTKTPKPHFYSTKPFSLSYQFQSQTSLIDQKLLFLSQSACKNQDHLSQIQTQLTIHGLQHNNSNIVSKVLSFYVSLEKFAQARKLFDGIHEPCAVCYNAIFKGLSRKGLYSEILVLFSRMRRSDVMPKVYTIPVVLKSCVKVDGFVEGKQLHCFVIRLGFRSNSFVGTCLIDVYSCLRSVSDAYRVFCEMEERSVVSWTSMINGYIHSHDLVSARHLFEIAPGRDVVMSNTMVSGYIEAGEMVKAQEVFDEMPCKDVMSWNTLLHGYAKYGDVEACEKIFYEMPERTTFSWNGLIGGYTHNSRSCDVLNAFKKMLVDGNVVPNDATLVMVLSSCAKLGALDLGKWVHEYVCSIGYMENLFVGNALIDMYAKCGLVESAIDVFKYMNNKDLISWNTIICGLANHGRGGDALNLFYEMKGVKQKPDRITFIGVLCACTHMGLVEEGFCHFQSMFSEYSIEPTIEHYGCMVDLLARVGYLDGAIDLVNKMPIKADTVIWSALLGASRVHKNLELAQLALTKLIELDPKNPVNYVVLSNVYGDLQKWKDVARLKVAMRDTGFRKLPGCSAIEVNDIVVEFYSLDERHHQKDQIYGALKGLTRILRLPGLLLNVV